MKIQHQFRLCLAVSILGFVLNAAPRQLLAQTAQATTAPTMAATAASTAAATVPAAIATPTTVPQALTSPFAYGVASGNMTANSAVLWTRTASATTVTPELSLSATFDQPLALPSITSSDAADFTVKATATGLLAGTRYYYRFKTGSDTSPVGTFKTPYAPDQAATVTMAFTGDADWKWKPYPVLKSLSQEPLDYFVFLGDLIYETTNLKGTTAVEDLAGYRWKYRENREPRANSPSGMTPLKDVYGAFGQYSVFDNHETGLSKADKTAPSYNEGGAAYKDQLVNQTAGFKARIQAYTEYQPVNPTVITGTGDPRVDQTNQYYYAVNWGSTQELLVLDDRSYRDSRPPNSDDPSIFSCTRTILGAPQLKWLETELLSAKQRKVTWKTIVISSPIQELGRTSQIGVDIDATKSWAGAYDCERDTLLKFIDDNVIDNVVFLTTDNHYTVINNLSYNSVPGDPHSPLKPAHNAFEILTGPLGASAGIPFGLKVDTTGLALRDIDRKVLAVLNGDQPNSDGKLKGLKQAGLDPIGLEATFPGLDVASISSTGSQPGVVEPADFASFNTFSYAVLSFSPTKLQVQVKGLPSVADPATLNDAAAEKAYENQQAQPILSFSVNAQ